MKTIQKFFVRIVNYSFNFAQYLLNWKEPKVLTNYKDMIDALNKNNHKKVLIVTDENIYKFNLTKYVEDALNENNIQYCIFKDVAPNPTFNNVYEGKKTYLENHCDSLIAIGGGSVMDAAKGIGVIINNQKDIPSYKGLFKVRHKLPLLIAFPTTCGTGSETTVAAVIRNEVTKEKFPIESMKLVPDYAFLEPRLLLNLPPHILSTTAMDALTHAIEAYLNLDSTKKTRAYSLEAIKLINENIITAYENKDNLEAKEKLLYASFLAGKAFTRSMVGNVHAIAHAIGGQYNLPHGYLNAIVLPKVLSVYLNKSKNKLTKISKIINQYDSNLDSLDNSKNVINWILELNSLFKIPNFVKELKKEDILKLSKNSYKEAVPLYPCPVLFDKNDFIKIYNELLENK